MSFANSKSVRLSTSFVVVLALAFPAMAWEVDFSRRKADFTRVQNQDRLPASTRSEEQVGLLDRLFDPSTVVSQDIVIMNTENGFVPEQVPVKRGGQYRLHIVNVNEKEKNVSFVLDAFSEHHGTLYGQVKTVTVSPKTDGVFTFNCPETGAQGKLVVIPGERKPASR